jgi:hypothetical protein
MFKMILLTSVQSHKKNNIEIILHFIDEIAYGVSIGMIENDDIDRHLEYLKYGNYDVAEARHILFDRISQNLDIKGKYNI